jgi:hypothetical protein
MPTTEASRTFLRLTDFSSDVIGVDSEVVLQLSYGHELVQVFFQFLLTSANKVLSVLHRHVCHQRVGDQVVGVYQRRRNGPLK